MESTMDPKLLKAFRSGNMHKIEQLVAENPDLFRGKTPQGNTALHLAARLRVGRVIINKILSFDSSFLYEGDRNGETPMHIAAKAGHASVIEVLFEYDNTRNVREGGQDNILSVRDNQGNTPLHMAVRKQHDLEAIFLINKLPGSILFVNDANQSPLSIAIDTDSTYIAWFIIREHPSSLDYRGPNDLTPLHSAVIRRNCAIVVEILRRKKELIDLVDEHKKNPLHHAAVSGNVAIVRRLLEADASSSLGYKGDCNGRTPLHLASENGKLSVLRLLLNHYPNSIEVLDSRQCNILHLAAQNGHANTVRFILRLPEIEDLINSPDVDGNTPLHLAAKNLHKSVVDILSEDKTVNIKATNLNQQTALAIIRSSKDPKWDIQKEENREMAQVVLLMATLIVTFTFTAALTLPGGYKDNSPNEGTAKLVEKPGFMVFVISITIAMTSAMTAAVLALGQIRYKNHERLGNMNLVPEAIRLLYIGLISMSLAFMTGLYVVLYNKLDLAVSVVSISCAFPALMILLAPLFEVQTYQLGIQDMLFLYIFGSFPQFGKLSSPAFFISKGELLYLLESIWLRWYDRVVKSFLNSSQNITDYFMLGFLEGLREGWSRPSISSLLHRRT